MKASGNIMTRTTLEDKAWLLSSNQRSTKSSSLKRKQIPSGYRLVNEWKDSELWNRTHDWSSGPPYLTECSWYVWLTHL